MNISVCIFGNFRDGYSQYPNDYTRDTFEAFAKNAQSTTQIAIHRDNDLMYYGYIRKMDHGEYLGLCVIINGKYITKLDGLFSIFERAIEFMSRNGYLIFYDDHGDIATLSGKLHENREEIDQVSQHLQRAFGQLENDSQTLPAVNYGVGKNSIMNYTVQDDADQIIRSSYTNGFTYIYKSKGFNTAQMNSYKGVVSRKEKQINELRDECDKLRKAVSSLKHKQRNTTWVSILGIVAVILFGVIYVKVINPSEVTKKDMGEYVYYGPMQNGEPNGTGVAIYSDSDKDGRLYYYGNFADGKRIDDDAIMFYKDGSYYKGSMNEDKWNKGIFFDVEKEHFIGEFKDNTPWNGDWYKHVKTQTLVNGK